MTFSGLSLVGALIMLVFGVIAYVVVRRLFYRLVRDRYERAKVTASQGVAPEIIWAGLKLVCMVGLPVFGFLLGDQALTPYFR